MKSTMKKILAVALVLMMTLPLVAFPAGAETSAQAEVEPLYTVNFNGDSVFSGGSGWAGAKVEKTQTSATMYTYYNKKASNLASSVWGADLKGFTILNKSYTVVFTLTASGENEEIGFFPDDWSGFVMTPGKDAYKFVTTTKTGTGGTDGKYEGVIASGTYENNKSLTQAYAIEFATEGTQSADKGATEAVTVYKLYVLIDNKFECVCSLSGDQLDDKYFDWFYDWEDDGETVYEDDFTLRLYRRGYALNDNYETTSTKIDPSNGTVTVSNMSIYEGLVAANIPTPHLHKFELVETKEAATCTEAGLERWSCECGEDKEIEVDALGHDYNEGTVTTEPTVETEGILTKTCTRCYEDITEAIVKTEAETPITDEPLYEVDFNGTEGVFGKIKSDYDGMGTKKVTNDGQNIELKIDAGQVPSNFGSLWSGQMYGDDAMLGKSYTVVFTVDAPDYQSVGVFLKWKDGFFINPMNNTYSVGHCSKNGADVEKYVATTEYDGSGKAVQTYAVEFASGSEANADGKYECSVYKLYVLNDGEWKLICALDADTREAIAWNTTDYEFMIQLARVSEDVTPDGSEEKAYTNTGSVIVSYMKVYEGHVAHTFAFVENKVPTCTEDGYDLYRCECGKEEERNEVSALGHDATNKETIKAPTCTEAGEEAIGVCTRCSTSVGTQPMSPLGHEYNEEITTAPTCTAQGTKTITCTRCDYSATEAIDALGHSYGDWATTAPTCTEAGFKTRTCATCGDTVKTDIPAIGHDWDEGVVTTAPTLEAEGVLTKTCKNDATHTTTEVIPKQPSDGDLLYTVNFNGDEVFNKPGSSWSGAVVTDKTETSMTMHTKKDASGTNYRGSAWGADLKGYTVLGNSYTVVFTVEASDLNQEIGFLPDDWAGFVVTPGQNKFRFITTKFSNGGTDGAYENVIVSGEYEATRSLKQTYAVEIQTSGTQDNPDVVAYKLYVVDGTEWKLVCALTDEQMDNSYFDWFYNWEDDGETVYEDDFTMRFYRRCYVLDEDGFATDALDSLQNGTVTVSDAKLYKGLVATNSLVAAPETEVVVPDSGNTDSGNTDSGNTDSGNTDSGNTDSGNTDSGNTDSGNTSAPETNAPETSAPETSTPATETEPVAKKGCGGSIAMTGVALVGACAAMLAVKRRKNEDD